MSAWQPIASEIMTTVSRLVVSRLVVSVSTASCSLSAATTTLALLTWGNRSQVCLQLISDLKGINQLELCCHCACSNRQDNTWSGSAQAAQLFIELPHHL